MITAKYCFVQFSESISDCEVPLPVKNLSDVRFFIDSSITSLNVDIVNVGGLMLREFVHSFNYFASNLDLSQFMATEDCFRLKLTDKTTGQVYYSNVFVYLPYSDYSLLQYWCDKDEFGFHYEHSRMNWIRLPMLLDNPSYVDSDEKYTDSNGRTRVLYKETRKKYVLKTDYIPYAWHDNLKVALMHDLVMIDGVEYNDVGSYHIGEEVIDLGCLEGAMGETEVAQNFVERNTNC